MRGGDVGDSRSVDERREEMKMKLMKSYVGIGE